MPPFTLDRHQLRVAEVHHNPPPSVLYEHAIRYGEGRQHCRWPLVAAVRSEWHRQDDAGLTRGAT